MPEAVSTPVELVYSYAAQDESMRSQLDAHLAPLRREGLITMWHAGMIAAGRPRAAEIAAHLNSARVILLLISRNSIGRDEFWEQEAVPALQRHEAGDAQVIPVVLRDYDWSHGQLAKLQPLPPGGRPIADWPNRDTAYKQVAAGIRASILELTAARFERLAKASVDRFDGGARAFQHLTSGLSIVSDDLARRLEEFLREYVSSADHRVPFGGRDDQLEALDTWLDMSRQPYALLVAPAGRGKSALLARWAQHVATDRRVDVAMLPVSIRFNTALRSAAFGILGGRLRYLHGIRAAAPIDTTGWLTEISAMLQQDHERPLVVLIDGIDEAVDWECGRDLPLPRAVGKNVKILLSARHTGERDRAAWAQELGLPEGHVSIDLPGLSRLGIHDVLESFGTSQLAAPADDETVLELERLSEGDPLLVRLYATVMQAAAEQGTPLKPEQLRALNPGLDAYFDRWWADQLALWRAQGDHPPTQREDTETFLAICACALGPLMSDEVTAIAGGRLASGAHLAAIVAQLSRFIIGDGRSRGYVFSHPRLAAYFYERLTAEQRDLWNERFVAYGRNNLGELIGGRSVDSLRGSYAIQYYGAHLDRAHAEPELYYELLDPAWMHAWETTVGTLEGFLTDVARVWRAAETQVSMSDAESSIETWRALALQTLSTLLMSSINSMADNLPGDLVATLVERGIWNPLQGLAYVRRVSDEGTRAWRLARIASHLDPNSLPDLVAILESMQDKRAAFRLLWDIAPFVPDDAWARVVLLIPTDTPAETRKELLKRREQRAISRLAPVQDYVTYDEYLPTYLRHRPEDVRRAPSFRRELTAALDSAAAIEMPGARAQALGSLAPYLPDDLVQRALDEALSIRDDSFRVLALAKLSKFLDPEQQRETLSGVVARVERLADPRAALRELVAFLPSELVSRRLLARTLGTQLDAGQKQEPWNGETDPEFADLALYFPDDALPQLVASATEKPELWDPGVLLRLAPRLDVAVRRRLVASALTTLGNVWVNRRTDRNRRQLPARLATDLDRTIDRIRRQKLLGPTPPWHWWGPRMRRGDSEAWWYVGESVQAEVAMEFWLIPYLLNDDVRGAAAAVSRSGDVRTQVLAAAAVRDHVADDVLRMLAWRAMHAGINPGPVIRALASRLDIVRRREFLSEVQWWESSRQRSRAEIYADWCATLHGLAMMPRRRAFASIGASGPELLALGGPSGLETVIATLMDLDRWFKPGD